MPRFRHWPSYWINFFRTTRLKLLWRRVPAMIVRKLNPRSVKNLEPPEPCQEQQLEIRDPRRTLIHLIHSINYQQDVLLSFIDKLNFNLMITKSDGKITSFILSKNWQNWKLENVAEFGLKLFVQCWKCICSPKIHQILITWVDLGCKSYYAIRHNLS